MNPTPETLTAAEDPSAKIEGIEGILLFVAAGLDSFRSSKHKTPNSTSSAWFVMAASTSTAMATTTTTRHQQQWLRPQQL